jgi:hypothetical protein
MSCLSVGSVAGHWLFSRRRWLNPSDEDDRRALEEGYRRLCVILPAFKACQLSTFLQVLGRTAESWARRASECWANHKIVVFTPRPIQAQYIASSICYLEAAVIDCGCDFVASDDTVGAAVALHRCKHQRPDWLSDSDCDESDIDDIGGSVSGRKASCASSSPRGDWVGASDSGPEDAAALQLLGYTWNAAATAADEQAQEGTAGNMDAVLESLTGRSSTAEEMEEWARSQSL